MEQQGGGAPGAGVLAGFQIEAQAVAVLLALARDIAGREIEPPTGRQVNKLPFARRGVAPVVVAQLHGQRAGGLSQLHPGGQAVRRNFQGAGGQRRPPDAAGAGEPGVIAVVGQGQAVLLGQIEGHRLAPEAVRKGAAGDGVRVEGAAVGLGAGEYLAEEAAVGIRFVQEGLAVFVIAAGGGRGQLLKRRPGAGACLAAVAVNQCPELVVAGGVLPGGEQVPVPIVGGGYPGEVAGALVPGHPRLPLPAGALLHVEDGLVGEKDGQVAVGLIGGGHTVDGGRRRVVDKLGAAPAGAVIGGNDAADFPVVLNPEDRDLRPQGRRGHRQAVVLAGIDPLAEVAPRAGAGHPLPVELARFAGRCQPGADERAVAGDGQGVVVIGLIAAVEALPVVADDPAEVVARRELDTGCRRRLLLGGQQRCRETAHLSYPSAASSLSVLKSCWLRTLCRQLSFLSRSWKRASRSLPQRRNSEGVCVPPRLTWLMVEAARSMAA